MLANRPQKEIKNDLSDSNSEKNDAEMETTRKKEELQKRKKIRKSNLWAKSITNQDYINLYLKSGLS